MNICQSIVRFLVRHLCMICFRFRYNRICKCTVKCQGLRPGAAVGWLTSNELRQKLHHIAIASIRKMFLECNLELVGRDIWIRHDTSGHGPQYLIRQRTLRCHDLVQNCYWICQLWLRWTATANMLWKGARDGCYEIVGIMRSDAVKMLEMRPAGTNML